MEKEVIRVWFCNRRQKEKRINPCSAAPMLPSPGKPTSYSPHLVPRAGAGGLDVGLGSGHKPVGIWVKQTYLEERPEELVLGALCHIHITVTKEPSFQENMPPNLSGGQVTTLGSGFSPCTMKVPGIKLRLFGLAASDSTYQTISQAPAVVLCGGYRLPHIHWHHHEGGIGLVIMTQVGPTRAPTH